MEPGERWFITKDTKGPEWMTEPDPLSTRGKLPGCPPEPCINAAYAAVPGQADKVTDQAKSPAPLCPL